MKTQFFSRLASNSAINARSRKKTGFMTGVMILFLIFSNYYLSAHCDSEDGPVIKDAKKAIQNNNVNYVLKWVSPEREQEITYAFTLMMKVRPLNSDAEKLADRYFFETLVRVHRLGEGESFMGLLPKGTPVDERILAADKAIELENLSPLKNLVPEKNLPELTKRFEKVISLKKFDVDDVPAGREYVEAYVAFFHFAETGETKHHPAHEIHGKGNDHHDDHQMQGLNFPAFVPSVNDNLIGEHAQLYTMTHVNLTYWKGF